MNGSETAPTAVSDPKARLAAAVTRVVAGEPVRSVAREYGLPRSTVKSAAARAKLAANRPPSPEPATLVAFLTDRVAALEARVNALERTCAADLSEPARRDALDEAPDGAFADLPGAEPPASSRSTDPKTGGGRT